MVDGKKYVLTKIGVKNADSRTPLISDRITGSAIRVYKKDKMYLSLFVNEDCKYLRTSWIEKWTDNGDETYLIETKNSVYTLELANG